MTDWELFQDWLNENEWYAENPEMREWVDDWADKRPNLPYSTKLKCAEQLAWQQFPEYFKKSDSILPCGGRIGDCKCVISDKYVPSTEDCLDNCEWELDRIRDARDDLFLARRVASEVFLEKVESEFWDIIRSI